MGLEQSAGHLTDAQARNLVVKALRVARRAYREADTMGEAAEREIDRLIKRKTRINATSLQTFSKRYSQYQQLCNQVQVPLGQAFEVAAYF
jgi:hypothetical protein